MALNREQLSQPPTYFLKVWEEQVVRSLGRSEGLREGMQAGIIKGEQVGIIKGEQRTLEWLVLDKFGPEAAAPVLQRLTSLTEPQQLRQLLTRVLHASSVEELGLESL